ncbi:Bifunctional 3-dehydroquinate dehydratase/shikimate dehydrogenase, chloroplastic [Tetrabaena socialis]|uniref:Bifunctional 3-dehydroquinate dehydratase/shikimate dehydrogenase, chloroplastic n=1 Tax=Tetrabaena socialis TaxID=47790 RepID=A0A2J7ZG78_9CHLO|nr:Bifunctional 3-dehydroquinate dehydratase/shikimate dehydrogenase, chloroplastic [Tetrabaena socialis]|eukprot:PNG99247.1 Bifunctional 3-dehydroquinate dehydratase/shikimate dehydrogenase, chloroplastic [Tetrabaena socialis]
MAQLGVHRTGGRCALGRSRPVPFHPVPQFTRPHESYETSPSAHNAHPALPANAAPRRRAAMQLRSTLAPSPEVQPATQEAAASYICTSVTATTVEAFLAEIQEAAASGVDIIELRLDFLTDFDPEQHLARIIDACPLPYIVTYRPIWEG